MGSREQAHDLESGGADGKGCEGLCTLPLSDPGRRGGMWSAHLKATCRPLATTLAPRALL